MMNFKVREFVLCQKIYDAYLEAPLHQKLELATKIQIEAYKSPEANINEKFNQIIQENAFR